MKICTTIAELRTTLNGKDRIALVPTMGNLHSGHLRLVEIANANGDCTVATIFVNRLQFGPNEDFDRYPRTFKADCDALEAAGCNVLFAPDERELYPELQTYKVHPPAGLSDILEGHFRPGFYVGVATVVMKLFQCVQPQVAVFGKKDYQQLMVIRNMVRQFAMPIEIIGAETERAPDGLALSSRNGYLSAGERAKAPELNALLRDAARRALAGEAIGKIEEDAMQKLRDAQWLPDYVVVRNRADLGAFVPSAQISGNAVALAAAKVGKTRLIDQWEF